MISLKKSTKITCSLSEKGCGESRGNGAFYCQGTGCFEKSYVKDMISYCFL